MQAYAQDGVDAVMVLNTAAGVVLFHPNIHRLEENIKAISPQVNAVYCFNNGVDNLSEVTAMVDCYKNVHILGNGENHGISLALNQIAEEAKQAGYSWLLSLDQDSVCPQNLITVFERFASFENIGAICPVAVDKRRPRDPLPKGEWSEVDDCITSGMFMNLDVFWRVGGMDENLFIDLVDDEYCYRLRLSGYRIIRVNQVVLDHELGELTSSKARGFWLGLGSVLHSKKVKALSYKRKVSPMRVYYSARNAVYLERKYLNHPNPMFSRNAAIKNGISNVLRSQDKIAVMRAWRQGMKDGRNIKVGAW